MWINFSLRGLVDKPAKSCIAGFSLISANCKSAVEILKERYPRICCSVCPHATAAENGSCETTEISCLSGVCATALKPTTRGFGSVGC